MIFFIKTIKFNLPIFSFKIPVLQIRIERQTQRSFIFNMFGNGGRMPPGQRHRNIGKKSVVRHERRTSMIDAKRPDPEGIRITAYLFRSENNKTIHLYSNRILDVNNLKFYSIYIFCVL